MKIFSIALAIVLSLAVKGMAQRDDIRNQFISRIDIVAGAGISFLRGGDPVGTNQFQTRYLKFSHTFGLEFDHVLDERKSISVAPMYECKGVVYNMPTLYFNEATQSFEQREVRLAHDFTNYTMAMLANFNFGQKLNIRLSAGPFISYLSKQIVQISGPIGNRGITDETMYNRNFEGGLVLRCGYRISLNEHISLTPLVSNLYGITSIREPVTYPTRSNVTYFQLALTIKQ